jgi:hypothetical protein
VSEAVDTVEAVDAAEAVDAVEAVNLFVDTSAFSAEDNLQAALNLFAKNPHLFQRTASGDDRESGSKTSRATCALVESSDDGVEAALDLLQVHPFIVVREAVSLEKRHNCAHLPEKEDHAPRIKTFVEKLVTMLSCFNRQNRSFTNCSCLKVVEDFDAATDELWIVASLSKNEQEPYYKEWINGREMTKLGRAQGYSLCIGAKKSCVYLCRNSFMNLLNLGRKRWPRLISTRPIFGKHKHKNYGNQNGAVNQDTEIMCSFIFKVSQRCMVNSMGRVSFEC